MQTHSTKGRYTRWHLFGLVAIAIGSVLLGGAALVVWPLFASAPLYDYRMDDGIALASDHEDRSASVHKGQVVAQSDGQMLARFELIDSKAGPVLTRWEPLVDAPFLQLLPPYEEVVKLSQVLQRHVGAEASVLAWWDVSRQFRALDNIDVVFDAHLGTPLFVPTMWRAWRNDVDQIETSFWPQEHNAEQQARFKAFTSALLMNEHEGMAQLQGLAQGKPLVLVLHARDAILLGQLSPSELGVAFREFQDQGDVHASINGVQAWLNEHDYPAYTVTRTENARVRAIALTDDDAANTLIARLLPFVGNNQQDVDGARLVYKSGGFIVYEIAAQTMASTSQEHTP